jgi:hypothetical protein
MSLSAERTLAKHPHGTVVHLRNTLTRIAFILVLLLQTVCKHVFLEVLVNKLLVLASASLLFLVVAIAEVVAETGVVN